MKFLEKYNLKPKNKSLYEIALTHSSYANEKSLLNYERLEFLGDAVLELVVSEYLYKNTNFEEGGLSKTRASYVCEQALVRYATDIDLISYIKVGHGQLNNINDTIVADVFESIIAAIYLDLGFDSVKEYIHKIIIPHIEKKTLFLGDYKSILQESVQTNKKTLEYEITNEKGPAHNKSFEVRVKVDGIIYGKGAGKSKKEAEQMAAMDAINKQAK